MSFSAQVVAFFPAFDQGYKGSPRLTQPERRLVMCVCVRVCVAPVHTHISYTQVE